MLWKDLTPRVFPSLVSVTSRSTQGTVPVPTFEKDMVPVPTFEKLWTFVLLIRS